jgi:hypothetical protein
VVFHDEIHPDEIPGLYAQCHVGMVALDPRHKTHNIPGKFLTYMQSGLPVLANINCCRATIWDRKHALAKVPGVLIWDDVVPGNSWGEAKATRSRMLTNGWRTALVVSDPPHLLRVAYAWSSNFWGTSLSYTLIETHPPWWSVWRWWANPYASSFVGDEVLKLGYYVVRYRFGLF